MVSVKIEQKNGKIYVFCSACNTVLVTNDQSYSLAKIRKHQLKAIGGCMHFEVVEVHKDPKSLTHAQDDLQKSVTRFENERYIIAIVPRES